MISDFNEVLKQSEKESTRLVCRSRRNWLRDFSDSMGTIDLDFFGDWFTWSNRQENRAHIKERIDHAICSSGWPRTYDRARVQH